MTAKKKVLKLDDDSFSEPEEILLLITSTNKDYRMAYFLNKHLKFDFYRQSNLQYSNRSKDKETTEFSVFSYEEKEAERSWLLVSNKHSGGNLLKKTGNIDFLLIIKGTTDEFDTDHFLTKLRKLPNVLFAKKTSHEVHKNIYDVLENLELLMISDGKKHKNKNQNFRDYN